MSRETIVAEVQAEISRLQQVLTLLGAETGHGIAKVVDGRTKAGRAAAGRKGRKTMSAAARRRISEIQKARWAKWRKDQK